MNELSDEDIKSAYLTGAFASADDWTVVGKYVTEFARAIIAAHEAQRQAGQEPAFQVGNLVTANQDDYPGMGCWFVQLWAGENVVARIYGNSREELNAHIAALNTAPQPAPVQAALAYHAALNETLNDTNLQLREDVAGYQAALAAKDAEIAALNAQLASLARGVKISIPTDSMEYEFQVHYRRGVASQAAEIAALRKALEFIIDVEDDTEKNPPEHRCYIEGAWKTAIDEARQAIAQAVQPTTKEKP